MMRHHATLLIAGLMLVPTAGSSLAQSAPSRCALITDRRGDVAFNDDTGYPLWVSPERTAGWDAASMDILSVQVSADRHDVITTMHVAGISDDPVRGFVWRVWLTPDATHPRERLETLVHRVTGGDTFTVHYEWWGQGPLPRGPVGSASGYTEDVPTSGTIDAARGLIRVRIPMTLLDRWHIKRSARIWDLTAHTSNAAGVIAGPVNWEQMYEGDAHDDAWATHIGRPVIWRLDAPGC